MLRDLYAKGMVRWETALTTRDTNRVVRPLDWGFDWLTDPWLTDPKPTAPIRTALPAGLGGYELHPVTRTDLDRMVTLNQIILTDVDRFFRYTTPTDFRLEVRHPELFPTNARPQTLSHKDRVRDQAVSGELPLASFLRFTSPIHTPHTVNDAVNARWYPAHPGDARGRHNQPRQAVIVLPQWNADAFSHNALCSLANSFGVSALRLSKPYHDIRRPRELERSDYAVSSNIGRTIASARQAVADIRACLDWLTQEGYTQFGVLGTSLGSSYAYLAAAVDPRLEVCLFNHASSSFGDVIWNGQSTRHLRSAFEQAGLNERDINDVFAAISPASHVARFASNSPRRRSLLVYATHDLTFPLAGSLEAVRGLREHGAHFTTRVLPCGHYTTGEFPFKYLDGFYLGHFLYTAFKGLRTPLTS